MLALGCRLYPSSPSPSRGQRLKWVRLAELHPAGDAEQLLTLPQLRHVGSRNRLFLLLTAESHRPQRRWTREESRIVPAAFHRHAPSVRLRPVRSPGLNRFLWDRSGFRRLLSVLTDRPTDRPTEGRWMPASAAPRPRSEPR